MTVTFPGIEAYDAGLDWVTCVTENDLDGARLRRIAETLQGLGERIKPWKMRGYNGRVAFDLHGHTGGVAYGEHYSEDAISYLAQAWGTVSAQLARDVIRSHHIRVSRLDYAVTVLFATPLPPVARWDLSSETASAYRLTRIVPNDDGGGTLYVGSRGSDVFGRVYDKGAQLGTVPERLYWRWEVEYKREHAKRAYAEWQDSSTEMIASKHITQELQAWFSEHGIPIPTLRAPSECRPVIRYATRVRSSDTTIEWLHQQVYPALRKLQLAGRLADALEALGVWDNELVRSQSELDRLARWEQTDYLTLLGGHVPDDPA